MNANLRRQLFHVAPPMKETVYHCLEKQAPRPEYMAASTGPITTKFPNDGYPAQGGEAGAYRGKPAATAGGCG